MDDALKIACRALQIRTIGHCLGLILNQWCITNWTALWQLINLLFASTPLSDWFHDLRYNFTCPLNKHPVSYAQVFALNISFVVKCCARNCYTTYIDRLK